VLHVVLPVQGGLMPQKHMWLATVHVLLFVQSPFELQPAAHTVLSQ
jgi:hypothetical protein